MAINLVIEACHCVGTVPSQCGVVVEDGCKLYDILFCINSKQKERGNKREKQMNQVCFMLCTLTVRLCPNLRSKNNTQIAAVIYGRKSNTEVIRRFT
jgi:hypothetical protein